MDENYELYHYGVKGMKWGVRKKVQTVVSNRKAYRHNKRVEKGHKLINRSGGSKKIANTLEVGRMAAGTALGLLSGQVLHEQVRKRAAIKVLQLAIGSIGAGYVVGGPVGAGAGMLATMYNMAQAFDDIDFVVNAASTGLTAIAAARGIKNMSDIRYASKNQKK